MANMSYCRFRNTNEDLVDCICALEDEEYALVNLSEDERRYAKRLYENALDYISTYEYALEEEQEYKDTNND